MRFTLSLHDALPIFRGGVLGRSRGRVLQSGGRLTVGHHGAQALPGDLMGSVSTATVVLAAVPGAAQPLEELPVGDVQGTVERSEEHTSELKSRGHLVC